ncbi:hypothetical protein EDD27_10283 [Nonomuraea polychroma]|uniref:Uncharacterized protein n=1 Tax=Nonomuraea polychroma TaxID=46176 RepID=A0A438MNK6_9ACTN|nr:hypothetical protein [Nonomuraea polychroma]RVX47353.1 hypothetical protein EDD27_10283 [Nonomuraea polychroma]
MSNSSSSSGSPFAGAYGNLGAGNLGANLDPRSIDPKFTMRHSRVRTLGTNVGGYGQDLTEMSDKTRAIDIHTMAFGTIGGGLNVVHRSVRDGAADALKQAKDVLDSWKKALNTAADNTEAAEEAGKGGKKPPGPGGPGGGGPGKIPGGGLGKMPKIGGMGDPGGVDPSKLGDPSIDRPSIPKPDTGHIKQPDLDTPDLDTPDPGDIERPDLNTPNPGDIQQPNLNSPDLNNPDLNNPGVNTPDLSGVEKPDTDLAAVNPNLPTGTTPRISVPDTSAFDPRASMARPAVGYPEGPLGPGGPSAGGGVAPGSIARALNTGIPPIYPPGAMGGASPGNGDNDRERGPHLAEEEGVWGMDEDVAPAVLGKEEI